MTTQQAPEPNPDDVHTHGLLALVGSLAVERLKSLAGEERQRLEAALREHYARTRTTQIAPLLGDTALATFTVSPVKEKLAITDSRAFDGYADAHGEYDWTPAGTRKAFIDATLKFARWDKATGTAVDRNGEVIPGVTLLPAGDQEPKVTLRWKTGGKEALADYLARVLAHGGLAELLQDDPAALPPVDGDTEDIPDAVIVEDGEGDQ